MTRSISVALICLLFLLPTQSRADGFGWYGAPFRFETLAEVFGGRRYTAEADFARIQEQVRKCIADNYGDEGAPAIAARLVRMMRTGWMRVASRQTLLEQWDAFDALMDCPKILPEFSFETESEMMAPQLFRLALTYVPEKNRKQSVMHHFLMFGRAFGALESYPRCRDTVPDYAVGFDVGLGDCSPVHLILSPAEVQRLDVEVRRIVPRLTGTDREYFVKFSAFLSATAA